MSEVELMQTGQSALSNSIAIFATFLTILGAYLVAANTIGARLNRTQILILNALFMVFSLLEIFSVHTSLVVANSYFERADAANTTYQIGGYVSAVWFGTVINTLAAIGCLLFMRDIRKTNGREEST